MEDRIKVKARITTLGLDANTEAEIENTPDVQQQLAAGWFVELRPVGA